MPPHADTFCVTSDTRTTTHHHMPTRSVSPATLAPLHATTCPHVLRHQRHSHQYTPPHADTFCVTSDTRTTQRHSHHYTPPHGDMFCVTSDTRTTTRHHMPTRSVVVCSQWCIAKNGGGYTQRGAAKGLKVPCLFMITEVSIRCQKNPDASCQLKSCQLPRNSAETTYTTNPDQIDGMKLEI